MTTENFKPDEETAIKDRCDLVVYRAAVMMVGEFKAPVEMVVDRMVTYAVALVVSTHGRDNAIKMLNLAATHVEHGEFDHLASDFKPH